MEPYSSLKSPVTSFQFASHQPLDWRLATEDFYRWDGEQVPEISLMEVTFSVPMLLWTL